MVTHRTSPVPWIASWCFQPGDLRSRIQWRVMPSSVSENVRKTLIEYMTTSIVMLPRV